VSTLTDLSNLIGRACEWNVAEGCSVSATIRDARTAYGRTDVFLEPTSGKGGAWVRLASVELRSAS
jgi:hypothetical protein